MDNKKFVDFLTREMEILSKNMGEEFQNDGYPDGNDIRLRELALKSAIRFYESDEISKIGDLELYKFVQHFKDAIEMKVLSPIKEEDFSETDISGVFECDRYPTLHKFSSEAGEVLYTDDARFKVINIRDTVVHYPDELELRILMDLYPIVFPYMPEKNHIKLFVDDDNRHKWILYAIKPDGTPEPIKRNFIKNKENEWEEIK